MQKTRTLKITERFCDLCGEEIEEHFGQELGKCPQCQRDICPRCIGVYKAEVSKFRGYSGTTLPLTHYSKTLCLECGILYEETLIKSGLSMRIENEEEL